LQDWPHNIQAQRAGLGHPASRDASWHAHRLSAACGFATYLRMIDRAAEMPPAGLIPAMEGS